MFQAQQILSTCLEKIDVSSTEGYDAFLSQLKDGLKNTSHETAANHKVAKVKALASLLRNKHTRSLIGPEKIIKHHRAGAERLKFRLHNSVGWIIPADVQSTPWHVLSYQI